MELAIILQLTSLITFVISVASIIYTYGKNRENPIDELKDELLPQIRANTAKLAEVGLKIDLFWNVVETGFPKFLRQECTPEFDILLDRADADPKLMSFSRQELHELLDEVNKDIHRSTIVEDSGRLMALAFYRIVVVSKLGDINVTNITRV